LRSFLARFLFVGEDVFKQVSTLSGGEKGRLALAKLIYSNVNVLALDEPTNHLDIPSREALEEALKSYQGTILTVSHDRYFLDEIATQIFSFENDGEVEIFNGNYTEFHDWKISRNLSTKQSGIVNLNTRTVENDKTEVKKPKPELSKNQRQTIENRIAKIEREISVLEENLTKITRKMSFPEVVSNHDKLQITNDEYQATEKQIQVLYEEWEKASESLT
jgi:ATP-binding cassette, subfamily F, member 3